MTASECFHTFKTAEINLTIYIFIVRFYSVIFARM